MRHEIGSQLGGSGRCCRVVLLLRSLCGEGIAWDRSDGWRGRIGLILLLLSLGGGVQGVHGSKWDLIASRIGQQMFKNPRVSGSFARGRGCVIVKGHGEQWCIDDVYGGLRERTTACDQRRRGDRW